MERKNYLTVTALTKYIARKFTYDPYLERVYLVGKFQIFGYGKDINTLVLRTKMPN